MVHKAWCIILGQRTPLKEAKIAAAWFTKCGVTWSVATATHASLRTCVPRHRRRRSLGSLRTRQHARAARRTGRRMPTMPPCSTSRACVRSSTPGPLLRSPLLSVSSAPHFRSRQRCWHRAMPPHPSSSCAVRAHTRRMRRPRLVQTRRVQPCRSVYPPALNAAFADVIERTCFGQGE